MSCCRKPMPLVRHPTRLVAVCSGCRASLRSLVAAAIQELSRRNPGRGVHRETAAITCPKCRLVNQMPVTWVKR
jgi:hypothetical protein